MSGIDRTISGVRPDTRQELGRAAGTKAGGALAGVEDGERAETPDEGRDSEGDAMEDADDGEEITCPPCLAEEEGRAPKMMSNPQLPSREERDAHEGAGHWPYRSWCRY